MIRAIMPRDVFSIADLAEKMHSESTYKNINFNRSKLVNGLLHAMAASSLVGFVDDKNEKIVGALISVLDKFFFGDDYLLVGRGFYVLPEYRKTKTGINLLREYSTISKKIGVKQANMDTVGMENFDHLDQLYKKAGFKKVGSVQIMDF